MLAAMVESAVIVTVTRKYICYRVKTLINEVETDAIPDNATSAFAMSVTKLEAVPPGAHPTRISPAESSEGNCCIFAILDANKGIIVN